MQHCAFVVTPERFRDIEARLKKNNVPYIGPIPQLPGLDGIYFIDPNGIRLEFARRQAADGSDPHVIECCGQSKDEALEELRTLAGVDIAWLEEMTSGHAGLSTDLRPSARGRFGTRLGLKTAAFVQ